MDDMEHFNEKTEMPSHTPGCPRGEDLVRRKGREPGRYNRKHQRTARDSTSIRAGDREPIDPRMPSMPPP